MFDLTGKTALVTGATGGIGAEIARALHAAGAHVVLSGTREAVLQELAGMLPKEKFDPTPLDEHADKGLFDRVKDIFG